jgi:PAS domain S-box-containing protein
LRKEHCVPRDSANSPLRPPRAGARGTVAAFAPKVKFPKALMAQAPGKVVEHLSEGVVIVDPDDQLIYWNPAALRMHGYGSAEEAVRSLSDAPKMFELATLEGGVIPPEEWPLARALRGESLCDVEVRIRRFSPAWSRIFRYSGSRVQYAGRRPLGFLTISDVTERKQTEKELERVSRLNVARSLINQAIIRTPERDALFQRVCQVLVEKGAFGMVWIGWRSARTQRLVPVAQFGDDSGYLDGTEIYADDRPGGRGPSGLAFRQGRPYVCNDVSEDQSTLPWRSKFEQRGLRASAAFPIRSSGKVRGILTVYANEVGFFRDKEVALLEEAAADLSFALDHFASEAGRRRAQDLAERERLFTDAMIESLPGVLYLYDEQRRFLRWNRYFAAVSGYADEEIARMHPLDFFTGNDRERVAREIEVTFEKGESSVEAAFTAKNGSAKDYFFTGKRISFGGVPCLIGMGIDISVRKDAEAATEQYARRLQATSHRLLTVQEAERRTLARELHDAVGQELTALSLNLTIIDDALPEETLKKVHERLEDSQALLEKTTSHLRNIMVELRPPGLDELGLLAALKEHVGQVARRSEVAVSITGTEPQPRLAPTDEIALFRIVQEALNNIVKHARASESQVSLRQNAQSVVLSISDNGVGFDTARKPIMGGYGMGTTTMRERAEAIGAKLQLHSVPGEGTRVTVELAWPPAVSPTPAPMPG